jgi:hypothetical protein
MQRSRESLFKASPRKQFARPYLEKTHHFTASEVDQGADPDFKLQNHK